MKCGYCFSFASGFGDTCGHLAEGLSTALQVFDDLQTLRQPKYVYIQPLQSIIQLVLFYCVPKS